MPRNFDLPDLPDWRTLGAFPSAVLGAIGGIAWAASLRGWMVEIAGSESAFDWVGTFADDRVRGRVLPPASSRRVRSQYRRTVEDGSHD